jgi:hypothetical protein
MKFTSSAAAASMAIMASAAPACAAPAAAPAAAAAAADNSTSPFGPKPTGNDVFRLMTVRSGSAIQYANVQAKNGGFVIGSPSQNSSCAVGGTQTLLPDINYASFSIDTEDGGLYLYTDNPPHQAFVDRSGMGQGVIGYTTGVQPIGKNQQRGPWKITDENNLVWAGGADGDIGFQACPDALGGGYSLWLAGAVNPGGNKDCVGINVKAIKEDQPIKCLYT